MDYGFAPGTDPDLNKPYYKWLRDLFGGIRPNTTLIHGSGIWWHELFGTSVQHFILNLDTVKPVGDLLLGTHGNRIHMTIPMFLEQERKTNFEILEETLKEASKSIRIPDALIGYTSGDPTHFVHIKGCNIGAEPEFLTKFKEALGGHVKVTAPKHFYVILHLRKYGVFESMAYEFVIRRKNKFPPDRNLVILEFQNAAQDPEFPRLINGSTVPDDAWENWIPKNIHRSTQPKRELIWMPLGVKIGDLTRIRTPKWFRVDQESSPEWTIEYKSRGAIPISYADRLQLFENELKGNPLFTPSHACPIYKRLGYTTFANFFAGYNWSFHVEVKKDVSTGVDVWYLVCFGTRYVYTLLIPITDPATGNLIFNFYRKPGTQYRTDLQGMPESNSNFFRTV